MSAWVAVVIGALAADCAYFYQRNASSTPFWKPFLADLAVLTASGACLGYITYDFVVGSEP